MKKQIFISYKAEERQKAERLRHEIENAGFSCWMAPLSIPGGSSYAAEIENAIKNCKALVLLFSKAAMQSKWVEKEVDRAINQNKLILPLRTQKFKLNSAFRYYLTNVQFYDAYQDYDFAVSQMIEQIRTRFEPDLPVCHAREEQTEETHKPKKVKKNKPEKKRKKPVKKTVLKSAAAFLLLVAIAAAAIGIVYKICCSPRMIAGETVYASSSHLEIVDHELTDKDIANINRLKNLSDITLINCGLDNEDVGKIKAFRAGYKCNLYTINLKGNKDFTDLSLLANIRHVNYINVSDTGINDFSLLSDQLASEKYSGIVNLVADDCELTSFKGLEAIKPNSRAGMGFSFCNCGIDNAKANSFMQTIRENTHIKLMALILDGNPYLSDLSFLKTCTDLTELSVSDTGVASLSGLEDCIYLEKISAENCGISSLGSLENTTVLSKVNLGNNKLHDISVLGQSSETMKVLFLGGNQIGNAVYGRKNADTIQAMTGLEMLDLSGNGIQDVSFLARKDKIKWLRLKHNSIRSLQSCLASLTGLKDLDVSENQLQSFDFRALPSGMAALDISNNHASLGQIIFNGSAADLDYFAVQGNTYTSIDFSGGKCGFMVLDYIESYDYSLNSFSDYTTVKTLKMLHCPLKKQVEMTELFADRISYVSDEEYDDYVSGVISDKRDSYIR